LTGQEIAPLRLPKGIQAFARVKDMQVFTKDYGMIAENVEWRRTGWASPCQ
jgi:hypothetical protein